MARLEKVINHAAATTIELVAAVAGQTITVWGFSVVTAGATTFYFSDGATALTGPMSLAALGSASEPQTAYPVYTLSPGKALNLTQSAAVQLSGRLYYTQSKI